MLVVISVFVSAGAQVVRGRRRREDSNVRIAATLRGLRRCILEDEGVFAHKNQSICNVQEDAWKDARNA